MAFNSRKDRLLVAFALLGFLTCGCLVAQRPDIPATTVVAVDTTSATAQRAQPASTATTTPTSTHTPTPTPTSTPSPTPADTPEPKVSAVLTSTLDTGWVLVAVPSAGFEMAFPPTWRHIDLDPNTIESAIAIIREQAPELESLLSDHMFRTLISSGIKLYGVDVTLESLRHGLPASVIVLKTESPPEMSLDSYVTASLAQIEALADPTISITHRRVTLSGREAEAFTYGLTTMGLLGEQVTGKITQHLLLDRGAAYTIIMFAPFELADTYTSVFQEMGQSFSLVE